MTEDEILAMEVGRDLNIRVAENVEGCKFVRDEIFGDIQIYDNGMWIALQPYSEDKSAALSLLERLEEHYGVKVDINSFEGRWEANLRKGGINYYYPDLRASSFPEAICKAALLTVLDRKQYEELADAIIEIELDMFERVRTAEPSLCKDSPQTFKAMRRMTHSVLSTQTLESYLEDLHKAKAEGRNLLTEKYARMDNRIPPLKTNPIIDDIVKIEDRWMKGLSEKYPHAFKGGPGFQLYLFSELETYSDKTLELYFEDVSKAEKEGRNLAEERYTMLFQQIGYSSIAEAERKAEA
ncbi:MAG: hypothetical protein COS88_03075 [Chloroflexi bacterium CG07_land_8_20_14_0_80_51_10]|nr:MAG: hypothetical protein COS88_03075 [Chloroflexi bacterium CG07_land_8_20_14_0_80_51_10]